MIDSILSVLSRWLYGDVDDTGRNAAMRRILAQAEPQPKPLVLVEEAE